MQRKLCTEIVCYYVGLVMSSLIKLQLEMKIRRTLKKKKKKKKNFNLFKGKNI
jgi:hypothetical protein